MKGMQMLAGVTLAAFLTFMVLRLGDGNMLCSLPCPEAIETVGPECSEAMSGECSSLAGPPVQGGRSQHILTQSEDSFGTNLSRFAGTWRAVDSPSAHEDKREHMGEEYLVLGVSEKRRKLTMALLTVASSPRRRVAHIETTLPIDGRLAGRFTFADDGWGNSGEGAVSLQEGQVVVQIRLRGKSGADWRMFSGQKVFVRER